MSTDLSELTCPDCGARDQREAFCDSCGAALSRPKAVPVEEPSTKPIPNPRSASTADSSPEPEPVAEESDTAPLPEFAPADSGSAEGERAEAVRVEAEQTEAEAAEAETEAAEAAERAERARALLVPVADQSAPSEILPVLPGKPEPIAPQRKESERLEALDAGIECQWCSIRNPPERHFCRRCGQRLAYAPVQARRPSWWRRLIFFWRNRPLPYAGQRPRLRRGPGQAIRPVVWTAVVVVVVVVAVNEYTPVSANVRDHFAKPNEISNWTIAASHEDPNHPAKLLHDTYSDTWWGSGFAPQNSNGASLTVTFSQPVNLLDMGLTPGAGTAADAFGAQGSPETVDVELIPIPGKGAPTKKTFTLDDQPGFQKFELRGDDIRQVVLTVTSSYQPTSATPPKEVETAITEVEFYTRH